MVKLDKEERNAIYRKISEYEPNLTDPDASIELKNVSAERIEHYESLLKEDYPFKPLFIRNLKGKLELAEGGL